MKRNVLVGVAALGLLTGCDVLDGTNNNPSHVGTPYALVRVGTEHVPVNLGQTTILADTLWLMHDKLRDGTGVLHQFSLSRFSGSNQDSKFEGDFNFQIQNSVLIYDQCPIGYYCAAALVYAPRVFNVVGDSLFETDHPGTAHYVYGRVK